VKRFGQFLLTRGLVSEPGLRDALAKQRATIVPVGALAIESSYLTEEQVRTIGEAQRVVDKRLGEIALERAWLTADQLRELLETQADRRQLLGEVLVQSGQLTAAAMEHAIAEFEALQGEHAEQLHTMLNTLPFSEVIRSLLDFTAKHFLRTTRQSVKMTSVNFERCLDMDGPTGSRFFSQRAVGDRSLIFGLLLDEPAILYLASRMLNEERGALDELVLDSVCEFVNMIVGNCLAALRKNGIRLHPDPPRQWRADEVARELFSCTRVEMVYPDGELHAVFSFAAAD
jgi:hypothetical protein